MHSVNRSEREAPCIRPGATRGQVWPGDAVEPDARRDPASPATQRSAGASDRVLRGSSLAPEVEALSLAWRERDGRPAPAAPLDPPSLARRIERGRTTPRRRPHSAALSRTPTTNGRTDGRFESPVRSRSGPIAKPKKDLRLSAVAHGANLNLSSRWAPVPTRGEVRHAMDGRSRGRGVGSPSDSSRFKN